ncbi:hypothetical protein ACSTLI_23120, partial [Vibrio parahaemolyticus]
IEQAKDLALHHAADCAERNQRLVDDVEAEGADVEIDDVADLADAVDLRGPALTSSTRINPASRLATTREPGQPG